MGKEHIWMGSSGSTRSSRQRYFSPCSLFHNYYGLDTKVHPTTQLGQHGALLDPRRWRGWPSN